VLAEVCNPSWPVWRVVSLMAADDPRHRIEDPRLLRTLLEDVSDAGVEQLFLQIVQRDRTIAVLRRQLEAVQAGAAHAKRTLAESESALAAVERTLAHTVPPEALATLASYVGEPGDDASEVGSACSSAPDLLACVNALRQAARPRQALRLVRHLLTRVTESTDRETWLTALYAQASLYRELGRDADSLESFDRILAVDGTIASNIRGGALFHSARLLDARGATAAARERLEACLALIPNHAAARAALGTIGRANP
jgi:tetratricopeptide (TPR) repeat protein